MTKMAKINKYRCPIYDQNSWKTIPFGAAHTYITHIGEKTPRGGIKIATAAFAHNISYAWLRHLPKIHHQASFARHFFKLSLPSSCFYVGILFIFAPLGITSWWNLKFAFSNRGLVVILASLMSSRVRAIRLNTANKKRVKDKCNLNRNNTQTAVTNMAKQRML